MRSFFQFRITTLLLIVAVFALACGWWADHRDLRRKLDHAHLIEQARRVAVDSMAAMISVEQGELDLHFRLRHDARPFVELYDRAEKTTAAIPRAAALSRLIPLLSDKEATTRARAAATLAQLGASAMEAVPALAAALDDADATVRWNAIVALQSIGPKALPAVPALAELMRRDATPAAIHAARALLAIDPEANVVHRLIVLLDADDVDTRRQAANRLRHIGPPKANAAVPKLIELLDDSNTFVRTAAIEAVAELASPEQGIPALKRVLENDGNDGIRSLAAHALIQIDARAKRDP